LGEVKKEALRRKKVLSGLNAFFKVERASLSVKNGYCNVY
jgi:hypothetical protein